MPNRQPTPPSRLTARVAAVLVALTLAFLVPQTAAAKRSLNQQVRAQLLDAVRAALGDRASNVRLVSWRASQPKLLRAATRLESLELINPGRAASRVTARLHLRMRDGSQRTAFATARAHATTQVWVARRTIERGEPLGPHNVQSVTRPLRGVPHSALASAQPLGDKLASRRLAAGVVLTRWSVTRPVLVKRGARASVAVRVGGVVVSTRGLALTDGRVGEAVRVRLTGSNRVLSGTVSPTGTVEVSR